MKIEQMSVVLTGAAGGIGSAAAHALTRAGARVVLVGRSPERLARLTQALAEPAAVTTVVADVTTAQGRAAIHAAALEQGANVLVNNAGLPCFGTLEALDADRIVRAMETNLLAPMLLTRLLLPHLRAQPAARILNVGSALGSLGLPGFSAYSAAKFGLRGFSEALRRELQGSQVSVQYLAPRVTRTAFNDEAADAFNRATGAQSDSPEQVAAALVQTLRRGTPERLLGFPEKLAARINGMVPQLLDGAFRRHRSALQSSRQPA
jgi:short-subunit dehydrogenase